MRKIDPRVGEVQRRGVQIPKRHALVVVVLVQDFFNG